MQKKERKKGEGGVYRFFLYLVRGVSHPLWPRLKSETLMLGKKKGGQGGPEEGRSH